MARDAKYRGTFGLSPQPIAGVTLYQDRRVTEPSLEEMIEELGKSDVREARKEELLAKLEQRVKKIRGTEKEEKPLTPNPKRYLVDPDSGVITVDEEEGELTYKDALLISASKKSKGGQFDEAIQLINAAKTLAEGNQPKTEDKKKEFYVDQETGIIVHDPENGEYTLSEARAVSQSMQRAKAGSEESKQSLPNYYVDQDGNLHKLDPGQPAVVKQGQPQLPKTYVVQPDGGVQEQQPGQPIIVKIEPSSNSSNLPALGLDKDGNPLFRNFDELIGWKRFESEEKRADERHKGLMEMVTLAKENIPVGMQALSRAASEQQGGPEAETSQEQQQPYQCGNCKTRFTLPKGLWEFVACPHCGTQYSREDVFGSQKGT